MFSNLNMVYVLNNKCFIWPFKENQGKMKKYEKYKHHIMSYIYRFDLEGTGDNTYRIIQIHSSTQGIFGLEWWNMSYSCINISHKDDEVTPQQSCRYM